MKDIESIILSQLTKNPETSYAKKDLAVFLKIAKFQYKILETALDNLLKHNKLKMIGKRYSFLKPAEIIQKIESEKVVIETQDEDSNYVKGTFDATSLARNYSYAFVITPEFDVFVSSEDILNAYHKDTVTVELRDRKGKLSYGKIISVNERARTKFVGNLEKYKNTYLFVNDNSKIHTNFNVDDLNGAHEGQKVVLEITNWGNKKMNKLPTGKVVEILGKAGEPEIEILSVIRQYDLPLTFPDEVLEYANNLSEEIAPEVIKKRRDLRSLLTFTIDPVSAKDFDDAISLEQLKDGWRLYVHIADVAHYVPKKCPVFKEALNRGNSYYFPKKVIPMIPERLSNKMCSLRPDEDKLTLTVITDYDKSLKVLKQEACESIIRSNSRLNYEEVDNLFDGKEHDIPAEVVKVLEQMRIMSSTLSQQRDAKGYLGFDLPEVQYLFDAEGHISSIFRSSETDSHKLIENFMLVANEYVAKVLTQKAPYTMYRIHADPEEFDYKKILAILKNYGISVGFRENLNKSYQALLESLPTHDFHRVFDKMILRSLKKARYSVQHIRHFGLAMETYTHFTSPIRRLCDLVVHHQLKQYVFKTSGDKFDPKEMLTMAKIASDKELIADESEREIDMKTTMHYMKSKVGEAFNGIITNMNTSSIFVELDDFPVTGVLKINQMKDDYYEFNDKFMIMMGRRSKSALKLTDKVKVLIDKVDTDIHFSIVDKPKTKKNKEYKKIRDYKKEQVVKSENKGKGRWNRK